MYTCITIHLKYQLMGRSQESFNKKEVRNKKEKKRKDKEKKRLAKKDQDKKGGLNDMIAYVDENGMISSTPPDPDKKIETKLEDIEISIPKQDNSNAVNPIRTGTVTYFNSSKGFGFIKDSETQDSVFVHVNDVEGDIGEGDKVNYEVVKGHKGPAAVDVKVLK